MEQRIKRAGELIGSSGDAATVERECAAVDYNYDPNNMFPSPPYHPDWCYQWVSVEIHGTSNSQNVARRRQQGYRPVAITEMPEFAASIGCEGGKETDTIRTMTQVLHKIPRSQAERLKGLNSSAAERSMQSETAFRKDPNDDLFVKEVSSSSKLTHTSGGRQVAFGSGR